MFYGSSGQESTLLNAKDPFCAEEGKPWDCIHEGQKNIVSSGKKKKKRTKSVLRLKKEICLVIFPNIRLQFTALLWCNWWTILVEMHWSNFYKNEKLKKSQMCLLVYTVFFWHLLHHRVSSWHCYKLLCMLGSP